MSSAVYYAFFPVRLSQLYLKFIGNKINIYPHLFGIATFFHENDILIDYLQRKSILYNFSYFFTNVLTDKFV